MMLFLFLLGFIQATRQQTNLEVKITPPENSQSKLNQIIQELTVKRKSQEKLLMQQLKKSFEEELINSGQQIGETIDKKFQFLTNPNIKKKIQSYKIQDNMQFQKSQNQPENIEFQILQDNTTNILNLLQNQTKQESTNNNDQDQEPKKKYERLSQQQIIQLNELLDNENTDQEQKKEIRELLNAQSQFQSFIELDQQQNESIMVKVFKQSDLDPNVAQLIQALEEDRQKVENQLFQQTIQEFKMITQQTIQELQNNLEIQLFPIFLLANDIQFDQKSFSDNKIENLELIHLSIKHISLIKQHFPIIAQQLFDLANQIKKEQKILLESPYENTQPEPNMNFFQNMNTYINKDFLQKQQSFLSLKENIFQIPGQDLNVKFKSEKSFPTVQKQVQQMEIQRNIVEKYELNQILKIQNQLQLSQIDMIKQAIQQKLQVIIQSFDEQNK